MIRPRQPALDGADARALRVACRLAVDAVGGPYSAATALGYASQGNLSASYDPHDHTRWMRVDHAAVLDRLAGWPAITACLARLSGYQLVPLPAPGACGVRAVGEMLRDLAPVLGTAATALMDQSISAAERADLLPAIERATSALALAHATLSQQSED